MTADQPRDCPNCGPAGPGPSTTETVHGGRRLGRPGPDQPAHPETGVGGLRDRIAHELPAPCARSPRAPQKGPTVTTTRFRKLPVEIEARQLDGTVESANRILGWIGSNGGDAKRVHATRPEFGLVIRTLEGERRAEPSDWIIRGVQGEFYPRRDDIFRQTYEAVPDGADRG